MGNGCGWEETLSIIFSGTEISCISIVQGLYMIIMDLNMGVALTERLSVRGHTEFFEVVDSDTDTHYNATTILNQRTISEDRIKAHLMQE